MKSIVAVDKSWGIGRDNDLLFSLPADMKHFRETTSGKVIVMGKNTLLSFPNGAPLKNRINVVLTSTGVEEREGLVVCRSLEELGRELKKYNSDDVFVVGGGTVYRLLCDACDEAIVTKVEADGDATVFFPNLDQREGWFCEMVGEPIETNGITVRFCHYKNNCVKEI